MCSQCRQNLSQVQYLTQLGGSNHVKRMKISIWTSYYACISTAIVTFKLTIFVIANCQLVETILEVVCEVGSAHNRVTQAYMLCASRHCMLHEVLTWMIAMVQMTIFLIDNCQLDETIPILMCEVGIAHKQDHTPSHVTVWTQYSMTSGVYKPTTTSIQPKKCQHPTG